MKALVLTAYEHLEYLDVPDPVPAAGEVLIAVKAVGICGSDVHGFDGSTGRRIPPVIMGHEAAGTIAALGAGVAGWRVGDRVTFDSNVYCGDCYFCRQGRGNLCESRRVLGVSCAEYRKDGAFAEYVTVPQQCLYRLPDALSFERAVLVEPLSIAVHAVGRPRIRLGDSAVVVGAGMIGIMLVQALRAAGCSQIVALDLVPERLQMARGVGADAALLADAPDAIDEIGRLTAGRGADLVFEAVGAGTALQTAVAAARKGAQVTLIGNLAASVAMPLQAVVTRELTLYGSCQSAGEYPACLELMARGAIETDPLISAVAPLSEGAAWIERLHRGDPALIKVVLRPD
ncbi:MAG: zinc-dependent alcohol dehydrogenase [Anaerolineae bacterium]